MKSEYRPPLGAGLICKVLQIDIPTSLKDLVLSTNEKWEERLERFLANFTNGRIEWICEVRATVWNEHDWRKRAVGLHLGAESVGVFATTSFAVIAASMQLQGFRQPPELPRLLWLAKQLPVGMPIAAEMGHNQETAKTKRES